MTRSERAGAHERTPAADDQALADTAPGAALARRHDAFEGAGIELRWMTTPGNRELQFRLPGGEWHDIPMVTAEVANAEAEADELS